MRWNGFQAVSQLIQAEPEQLVQALANPKQAEVLEFYLVCTHGSRDPCCGLLGIPIFRTLTESAHRPVLQVSHLGGHRFAPVLAAFPEWRFFGHLNPDSCLELDRCLKDEQVFLEGYRGHGQLKAHLQTVEAVFWQKFGSKLKEVKQVDGNKKSASIKLSLQDGSTFLYEARFHELEYRSFKSCKDFRKNKESTLSLPVLESLKGPLLTPTVTT